MLGFDLQKINQGKFVKLSNLFTASILTAATLTSSAIMADSTSMSAAQTKEIQTIVHDYLVSHPEVLIEASQALQQKQQVEAQQQSKAAIGANADLLFNDKMTVVGNPQGKVTLVEFFDYQCIHCKKMAPVIGELVSNNKDLRVIYKEFPIFGKSSENASRAALAASMQGKYLAMHEALLKQEGRLNDDLIDKAAKSIGLDMTKFKADMNSQQVTDALEANRKLGEKLHLMGTPAFIIASTPDGKFKTDSEATFIPGAASSETLKDLIQKANS